MSIDGGDFDGAMIQTTLKDPQIDPGFQHMSGSRMAQGVNGGLLVDATFEHSCTEGALHPGDIHRSGRLGDWHVDPGWSRKHPDWMAMDFPILA
jgi:hypothetical protein